MATVTSKPQRGRPRSALRNWVAENAPKLRPSTTDKEVTITVGKTKNGRPDTYTEKFPNNSLFVPAEMVAGKSKETAYELARLARSNDSTVKFSIGYIKWTAENGTTGVTIYIYIDARPKKSAKSEPKKVAKTPARKSTKK
jgi:hypothetical protein